MDTIITTFGLLAIVALGIWGVMEAIEYLIREED